MLEPVTPRLNDFPDIMNAKMVASYLSIGYVKALSLLKSGSLPCIRIGNSYKVSRSQFETWLQEPGLRKVL